jgi:hypothetical protein
MPRRKHSAIATFEKASVAASDETLAIYNMGWDPDSGEPMSTEHAEFLRSRNITLDSERAAQKVAGGLFNKAVVDGLNRSRGRPPKPENSNDTVVALLKTHRPEDFQGRFTLKRAEATRIWLEGHKVFKSTDAVTKLVNRTKRGNR